MPQALEIRSKWWQVIARWRAGFRAQAALPVQPRDYVTAARYGVPSTDVAIQRHYRVLERVNHFGHGRNGGLRGACEYIVDLEDALEQHRAALARAQSGAAGHWRR